MLSGIQGRISDFIAFEKLRRTNCISDKSTHTKIKQFSHEDYLNADPPHILPWVDIPDFYFTDKQLFHLQMKHLLLDAKEEV